MTDLNTGAAPTSVDAKAAATEFLKNFNSFKDDVSKRMTELSTRVERMDRKQADLKRPALMRSSLDTTPHRKAIGAYLRQGDDDQLRSLGLEGKALNTAMNAEGGYLVDPQTSDMVHNILSRAGSLRAVANVVQVEATAYDVLVDHGTLGAGWMAETGPEIDPGTPAIDRISITLHELSASPCASQRILDDAAFDLEAWLAEVVADRFLRAEADAFVNGNGVNKPVGLLTKTMVPNATWSWDNIGYVATGTPGDFDANEPADKLIELVYTLGAEYRAGAAFIMNSKTAGELRKVKDSQGRFLWHESIAEGQPARLLGYPVAIVEDMPDIDVDSFSIAFGDFGHGYTVAERPDIRILRDPYSNRPNVTFFATKRVGGDVTDFAAIKTLKFGAS